MKFRQPTLSIDESAGQRAKRVWQVGIEAMALLVAVGVFVWEPVEAMGAGPIAKEYEVKAAFLFNFALYVEWPSEAFSTPTAPITIGILGDDMFGGELDRIIRGETVKNRPITIHRSRQIENLQQCHLLFISKSERGRLASIFARLAGKHCLTVGETDRFAHSGGIINFRLQGANVRFEINMEAAKRSGLTISSKLLRLATIIDSERVKGGK